MGLFNSLTLITIAIVMLDLARTTNEKQLESQGVTKSERKTDTECYAAVRQSHPPNPCWVSHKGIRRSLCVCPVVCLYWLMCASLRWHAVPYGQSQTHITSDSAHTCGSGALWKLFICTTHLQDYSTQHFCQSERGACFFHWVNHRIGKTTKGFTACL